MTAVFAWSRIPEPEAVEIQIAQLEVEPDRTSRQRTQVRFSVPGNPPVDPVGGMDPVTVLQGEPVQGPEVRIENRHAGDATGRGVHVQHQLAAVENQ